MIGSENSGRQRREPSRPLSAAVLGQAVQDVL